MTTHRYAMTQCVKIWLASCLTLLALNPVAVCGDKEGTHHALIICGLPGDDEHRKLFSESAKQLRSALTDRFGIQESRIRVQFGRLQDAEANESVIGSAGRATRDEIAAEADRLAAGTSDVDTVWVFVIGHTYVSRGNSVLSVPERDLNHREFARLFNAVKARQTVFFICTPASGPWIRELSEEGRIIVTATNSARETNGSIFHTSVASTFSNISLDPEFDLDKDGRISLLDLYLVAARHLVDVYRTNDPPLIITEHPLLDDNADRKGSELQIDYLTAAQGGRSDAKPEAGRRRTFRDGALAAAMELPLSQNARAGKPPSQEGVTQEPPESGGKLKE